MDDIDTAREVRRWKDGDLYYAANSLITMCYAVTHDRTKLGTVGIQDDLFVQFISADQGRLWDATVNQSTT